MQRACLTLSGSNKRDVISGFVLHIFYHKENKEMDSNQSAKKKFPIWAPISAVVLIGLIVAFILIYNNNKPTTNLGSKAYTLEVVDNTGATDTYKGTTDKEYLSELMDELSTAAKNPEFSYSGSTSSYGLFIETINGLTADYNVDKSYWAIYVNDSYGQYGADAQVVSDGDTYSFKYETSAE